MRLPIADQADELAEKQEVHGSDYDNDWPVGGLIILIVIALIILLN